MNQFLITRDWEKLKLECFEMEKLYATGIMMVCINSMYISKIDVEIKDASLVVTFPGLANSDDDPLLQKVQQMEFPLPETIDTISAFIRRAERAIYIVFNSKERMFFATGT